MFARIASKRRPQSNHLGWLLVGLLSLAWLSACGTGQPAEPALTAEWVLPTVYAPPTAEPTQAPTTPPTPTATPEAARQPTPDPTLPGDLPPTCMTAGQTWTSPVDGMALVCVPAGSFTYGAKTNGSLTLSSKTLAAFWMDRNEVTNAQYAACVAAQGCNPPGHSGTLADEDGNYFGNPKYADYPVIYVGYYDAQDYCQWAGRRLPTEMEWQKAARGPFSKDEYPWGSARPGASLGNTGVGKGVGLPVAVGSYPKGASYYGIFDLAGNVREWTSTRRDQENYYVKGGSFDSPEIELEISSLAVFYPPTSQSPRIGLRCARDAP